MDTPIDFQQPDPAAEAERTDRDAAPDRGGFLGYVAHEVRNPLSTALWTAEMLARMPSEERGGARGAKLTAMSLRALTRVRQLVEDHFLVERLDAGGLPSRPERVELRRLLDEVLARDVAPGAAVDVPADVAVRGDPMLVDRALESLLAAASADGAHVTVEARAEGDRVRIVVTGAPPRPDALEDPRKGSPSDNRGRSLALPVVRRVARALEGVLTVENGSFALSLPWAYTPAPR